MLAEDIFDNVQPIRKVVQAERPGQEEASKELELAKTRIADLEARCRRRFDLRRSGADRDCGDVRRYRVHRQGFDRIGELLKFDRQLLNIIGSTSFNTARVAKKTRHVLLLLPSRVVP